MNWKASESDPAPDDHDERDESEKILTELSQDGRYNVDLIKTLNADTPAREAFLKRF